MSADATESGERHSQAGPPPAAKPPATAIDAFVSYASHDAPIADAIVEALEKQSLRCWIAPRDVTPGSHYADHIMSAITGAKVLVLVLSESALASKHVGKEVERASSKGRPIIALRTDASPLTPSFEYFLSESQWIDVGAGGIAAIATKLGDAVRSHADAAPKGPGSARVAAGHSKTLPLRRWVILAVAVVSALLLGYQAVDRFWLSKHAVSQRPSSALMPAAGPAAPTISEKSIAVLPFIDMSEKKDQEYFADGLAEELLDLLAKTPGLKVIARTSSFSFKGKSDDIPTIAQKLGVAHVLEGSVRTSGSRLRVTTQLIRADTGEHLWSETYDREARDVFKVQDEIAGAVVKALKLSLLHEPRRRVTSTNPEAYALYLRGRTIVEAATTAADYETGLGYLERSTQADPGFAPAWATIARIRIAAYMDFEVGSFDVVRRSALDAAQKAIDLDPSLAEAHLSLARAMVLDWRWSDADREMSLAMELEPSNPHVLRNGYYLSLWRGRWDQAFDRAKTAVELDSLNYNNFERLGDAEFYRQRYAEAEAHYREALELSPVAPFVRTSLADSLLRQGKLKEVMTEAAKETFEPQRRTQLPYFLNALGRSADAAKALADAESKDGGKFPYSVGIACASLGNLDRAFFWWDRALRQHDAQLVTLLAAPIDARQPTLSADSRYKALLHKVNLDE